VFLKCADQEENEPKSEEREPDNSCQKVKEERENAAYSGEQ
jgi:hypothetical protein